MKRLFFFVFLLTFLAFRPAFALSFDEARHLLARLGFGQPARVEIERLLQYSQESAVEEVFGLVLTRPLSQPSLDIDAPAPTPKDRKAMSDKEKMEMRADVQDRAMALKSWWWGEMLLTDSPFTEHMVLFWHNYFTSSLQKTKWPGFMYRQNLLFRQQALGNFGELLQEIVKDPAMVLYLDTQTNRKGQPNENFARELMELFTLGEGNFSETDVKEAARAFTGWRFDARAGEVVFDAKRHDAGPKKVLGQVVYDGEDVVRLLLERPETAKRLVTRFWLEFVSPDPDDAEIAKLADLLRDSHYEIRPVLKALFTSHAFWAPENRGALTKSPVDVLVGSLRMLGVGKTDLRRLAQLGKAMGQDLFDPPNVKGWPGGDAWITSTTLSRREQFLRRLMRGREGDAAMADPGLGAGYNPLAVDNPGVMPSLADLDREAKPRAEQTLKRLLLCVPPVDPPRPGEGLTLRQTAISLLLDPAYQVK